MKDGFVALMIALGFLLVYSIVKDSMPNCERDWKPQLAQIEACIEHPECQVTALELEIAERLRKKIKEQCDKE